jgi:cytochrome c553
MRKIDCLAILIGAAACLSGSADAADATRERNQAALMQTVQTCGACHGVNGHSVSPTFPNLAGQSADYLVGQLKAFKGESRGDPDAQAYMWGMASQLSDPMVSDLADYFARQPATPGRAGDPALIAAGKRIFESGVAAQQIPPCASCHGAQGQGIASFPRLAGQHAPYLLKQLLVIQNALRSAPVMHGVVKDLTKGQMQAVATYLESI